MSWNIVKIGKVLKQYRIEHWVQNDKLYKQVSILNDGSVVLRGEKIGKEIGRKRQFIINLDKHPDTLIFTRQLLLQGSIGMASKEVNGCIVTENMPMFSVDGIIPQFLFYFIKSELFKAQVRNLKTSGTAQKSLHERQFLDLEIPLPPLKEQREIIARCKLYQSNYEKIDKEIYNQQTHLQLLRQAILQEAVQGKLTKQNKDDEPADKLLQRIKAEKQKLVATGKLKKEKELPPITDEEIPFELPKGWVWCRLGEIINEFLGGYAFKSTDLKKDGKNQVIRLGNVKNDKVLLSANPVFINEAMSNEASTNQLYTGDILITMTGTRLKRDYCYTVLLNEKDFIEKQLFLNQRVGCLRFNKQLNLGFVNLALKADNILDFIFNAETGTANQGNIGVGNIKSTPFPLPPLSEQHRIVAKVQQLLQLVNELEQQVAHSQVQAGQLLQAVLKEAFAKTPANKGSGYAENEMITMAAEE